MAFISPLGLTDFSETTSQTESSTASENNQTDNNPKLANTAPEQKSQIDTANFNRSPNNNRGSVESGVTNNTSRTSSLFNSQVKYFNYRGVTNTNEYAPNKLIEDQHDLSINSIVDFLKGTPMALNPIDFAYLKNLGVYPNNRMIVARRYPGPVYDDLFYTNDETLRPVASVVSWVPPDQEFMKIDFNEEWEDHNETIQEIFSGIMEEQFGFKMPETPAVLGWTGGLRYDFLKKLGVTDAGADNVPEGNPNMIMETKRRKTLGNSGGSALASDFEVTFEAIYDTSKYIPGIDPSVAYLDLIANLITFGTSNSQFYLTGEFGGKLTQLVDLFRQGKWYDVLVLFIDGIINAVKSVTNVITDFLTDSTKKSDDSEKTEDKAGLAESIGKSLIDTLDNALASIGKAIISKYKEKIMGALAAMTGAPNGYWHVTIGNPRNPIFMSGDMVCTNVEIELGKELGFNDLPTEIKATIKLVPARNLGAQEIASKFNSGKGRIYGRPDEQYISTQPNNDSKVSSSQNTNNKNSTTTGTTTGGSTVKGSSTGVEEF
jgi:hypothetical protein